jgi:replicative DNA helicase
MEKIAQVLPFAVLKNLAESDVLWDEIIEITPLGIKDVYDASVAEVHNFVAEDFIVHNSIEQDADIVLFLYRPEYYGITQDMEGNPTTNVGEVIVAKHRNGSLDTVKLKFIGKFTKFENLDNFNLNVLGNNGASDNLKPITLGSKVNNQPQFNTPPTTRLDDEPPF